MTSNVDKANSLETNAIASFALGIREFTHGHSEVCEDMRSVAF